jgi:hypothetical protein
MLFLGARVKGELRGNEHFFFFLINLFSNGNAIVATRMEICWKICLFVCCFFFLFFFLILFLCGAFVVFFSVRAEKPISSYQTWSETFPWQKSFREARNFMKLFFFTKKFRQNFMKSVMKDFMKFHQLVFHEIFHEISWNFFFSQKNSVKILWKVSWKISWNFINLCFMKYFMKFHEISSTRVSWHYMKFRFRQGYYPKHMSAGFLCKWLVNSVASCVDDLCQTRDFFFIPLLQKVFLV